MVGFDVHRRQVTVDALDTAIGRCGVGRSSDLQWRSKGGWQWVVHLAAEAHTG